MKKINLKNILKKTIKKTIDELISIDKNSLIKNRMEKFSNMGIVKK